MGKVVTIYGPGGSSVNSSLSLPGTIQRTPKDSGIDLSGDATMEMYRRMRDRQRRAEEQTRERDSGGLLSRLLGKRRR